MLSLFVNDVYLATLNYTAAKTSSFHIEYNFMAQ